MEPVGLSAYRLIEHGARRSASLMIAAFVLFLGSVDLHSECPNSGETKVFESKQGAGYYIYRFLGDSSFRYLLGGKAFSYNDKSNPGRTVIFIDDFAYESLLVERADFEKYVKSSKPIDILRAQAKHEQEYYKGVDPSMVITDYGPASTENADGSENRLFYLWKKENPPGKEAARQFLVSTLVNDRVVLLSVMVLKESTSDDDALQQIQKYTSHFDLLSSNQCARVLTAPSVSQ